MLDVSYRWREEVAEQLGEKQYRDDSEAGNGYYGIKIFSLKYRQYW